MTIVKRTSSLLAGAAVVLLVAAAPSSADSNGPAIKYFKAPLPVVGGTLSDSSSTPSFNIKDGWALNDADGVCSASTYLYLNESNGTNIWSYSGSRSTTSVSHNYTWSARIGRYDYLYTYGTDCLNNNSSGYDYIEPSLQQEGAGSYGPGWTTSSGQVFSGGAVLHSSTVGAHASYSFSGRLVSLVSDHASNRGKVSLSVDGGAATTVTLTGATVNRDIVWNSKYLSSGTHLLSIKVVSGRVDVDGFITE